MNFRWFQYILILSLTFLSLDIFAHSFEKKVDTKQSQWNTNRLSYMPFDRSPSFNSERNEFPGLIYLKNVVVLPSRWAQTQKINVCFVGGTQELRKKILNVAQTWFERINLEMVSNHEMTCKNQDRSEVRIGFSEPGHWSYIGNDSVDERLISKSLTSMNLQSFDDNPPDEPEFTRIVLHEWGRIRVAS